VLVCILPPIDGAQSNCEHIDDDLAPVEPADVCAEVQVFDGVGPDSEHDRVEQQNYRVIHLKATRQRRKNQPKTAAKTAVGKRVNVRRR
jgi:hypothetical protein